MSKQLAISTFASVMAMAGFVLFSGPAAAGQAPRGLVTPSVVSQVFAPVEGLR